MSEGLATNTKQNVKSINVRATLLAEFEKVGADAFPANFNKARFTQEAVALAKDNPDLLDNPQDFIYGLMKGARLGLSFAQKECYLIKYGNGFNFQTDYKGEIKFTKQFSTRPIKDIYAKVVRKGDEFEEKIVDGHPSIDFRPIPFNGDECVGVFAICLFEDGGMIYETMSKADVESVRSHYSKQKEGQAWKNSWDEMAKKVCLRRLTKHIDKNIDQVETLKAYEEGSGMDFNKGQERSEIVSDPFSKEEVTEENVIDVESVDVSTVPTEDIEAELPFK